jgi:hypothetical protein
MNVYIQTPIILHLTEFEPKPITITYIFAYGGVKLIFDMFDCTQVELIF